MPEFKTVSLSKDPAPSRYAKRSAPAVTLDGIAAWLRKTDAWTKGEAFKDTEIVRFMDEAAKCCQFEIVADVRFRNEVGLRLRDVGKLKSAPDGCAWKPVYIEVYAPSVQTAVLLAMDKVIREAV